MADIYKIKDRLSKAMKDRDMSAADLAKASNQDKASISRYLSGKTIPRQKAIKQMAKALRVDPVWLLGYDPVVSGHETETIPFTVNIDVNGKQQPIIIEVYDKLNKANRQNAVMYLNYLLKQQRDEEEGSDDSKMGR